MKLAQLGSNIKLAHKAWILIAVPVVFELAFVGTLSYLLNMAEREAAREAHSKAVLAETTTLTELFYEQTITALALSMLKGSMLEERFDNNMHTIVREVQLLKRLADRNDKQKQAAAQVEEYTNKVLRVFAEVRYEADHRSSVFQLKDYRKEIKTLSEGLHAAIHEVASEEQAELVDPSLEAHFRSTAGNVMLGGTVVNLFLAVVLTLFFNSSMNSRFKIVMDNTVRMARKQQLHPVLEGNDELSVFDRVFHNMALSIEDAARKERAIVEFARDVIFSLDEQGIFCAVSPAASSVWGYAPEELIGAHYKTFLHGDDVARTEEALLLLKNGENCSLENRFQRKDGSPVELLWSVAWSSSERSFFCVAHDITQRKEMERMKQEFVNVVSHDLRTPLTAIQCTLQMLSEGVRGELPPAARVDVSQAEASVNRLISLINDLLDAAKMESGKWQIVCREVSIAEVLDRAVVFVVPLAKSKDIAIEVEKHDVIIHADADRLIQVVVNLLSNSLKYSPQGGKVSLCVRELPDEIEVRISDQGPGVAAENRQKIFERFEQAHGQAMGTSGLGLAICKAIVTAHHGQIGVDSEPNMGSTFWFRLPRTKDTIEDGERADQLAAGRLLT